MIISNYLKTEDVEDYIVFITDSCDSLTDSDKRMIKAIRLVKAVNYTDYSIQLLKDYLKDCLKHSANSLSHKTMEEARNVLKNYKVMRDKQTHSLKRSSFTKDDFEIIDEAMSDHISCMMNYGSPKEKDFARLDKVQKKLGELRDEQKQ